MDNRIVELAAKYKEERLKSEELSAKLKEQNEIRDTAERALIDAMVEEGVKNLKLKGIGLFSLVSKNYLSVNAENKAQFLEYLKASGNGAIIKEDVHFRTLTSFLKDHLEDKIKQFETEGLDTVDAKNAALKFLNEQGAAYFSDTGISLRSE